MTDYKPGDIANGHVLTNDHGWVPIAAEPSTATPQPDTARTGPGRYKRFLWPAVGAVAVVGLLLGVLTIGSDHPAEASAPRPNATSTPPPASALPPVQETPYEPEAYTPSTSHWAVKLKVTRQQCFGSAGCNVTLKPKITYTGSDTLPYEGSVEITYKVSGDESGPVVETATVTFPEEQFSSSEIMISTSGSGTVPKARVTDVEYDN